LRATIWRPILVDFRQVADLWTANGEAAQHSGNGRGESMGSGTILFVHGTGVRLKAYKRSVTGAKELAVAGGITATFVECAWGDPLGVEFEGLSLPDPPTEEQLARDEEDFARWSFLFADPLFELDKLTIRDAGAAVSKDPPGRMPGWEQLWNKVAAYEPSDELTLLLRRGELRTFWPHAWSNVVKQSPIPKLAFQRSAHELADAAGALARAVVAEIHVVATANGTPGPSRALREMLVARLLSDWDQQVYAKGTFLANLFKRVATRVLRAHRSHFSDMASLPIGDILLYQSRGHEVRSFLQRKIEKAAAPVSVVAHSLGGIACVDLLALPNAPKVARLVTVGSQSPLLYEIGALASLKRPDPLPSSFPPWLNVYDRNDFLSYRANRLFPTAEDFIADSGQPFPDAHSAYFSNEKVWKKIREFGVQ
jgi:hypothetical protein